MKNEVKIIIETILEMDKPFSISDLFIKLANTYNITNKKLILDILDSLLDSGLVNYDDLSAENISYISPAFKVA